MSSLFKLLLLLAAPAHALDFAGARAEALRGDSDGDFTGALATLDLRLHPTTHAQLYALRGDLADAAYTEAGLHLYHRRAGRTLGLLYNRKDFLFFATDQIALHYQRQMAERWTLLATLGYEARSHAAERGYAGLLFRLYPRADLLIDSGPTYFSEDRLIDADFLDLIDIRLHVEYQPPPLRRLGLSLYLEDRAGEFRLVGLRHYFSRAKSLLHHHRQGGILRMRE